MEKSSTIKLHDTSKSYPIPIVIRKNRIEHLKVKRFTNYSRWRLLNDYVNNPKPDETDDIK